MELNALNEGDCIADFVGPLGTPSHLDGLKKGSCGGRRRGLRHCLPHRQKLHELGAEVHSIVGFRSQRSRHPGRGIRGGFNRVVKMSDDGSWGEKGLVTNALEALIKEGNQYDEVIAIGPLVMMKFVCKLTKEYGIKTMVSMNPIMIDGTGMCGGCRLTVGGKTKFACVDGPDFDGHEVDFDEAMHRGGMYRDFEAMPARRNATFEKGGRIRCRIWSRKSAPCRYRTRGAQQDFSEVALGYTAEMAVNEAKRCLHCKNKPCVSGCPVRHRYSRLYRKVAEEDFEGPSGAVCLFCAACRVAAYARRKTSARV